MDNIEIASRFLQPYKDLVATLAGTVTILQFFAGVLVCKDIQRRGSTRGFSSMPFIGGTAIGILFLQYGVILEDETMILVNLVAVFLNTLYTVYYYLKSENKNKEVLLPTGYAVAVVAAFLGYVRYENPALVEHRFGLILTVLMLFLLGMPLLDVKEIITNRDASRIPFPITFMGTLVTFLWLLYGVILLNNFMIAQNALGFILCCVQLVLIVIFRSQDGADQPGYDRPASSRAARLPNSASRPPSSASLQPSSASRPPSSASLPPSRASRPSSSASLPVTSVTSRVSRSIRAASVSHQANQ